MKLDRDTHGAGRFPAAGLCAASICGAGAGAARAFFVDGFMWVSGRVAAWASRKEFGQDPRH
ncbi:MAG TPA: hypothetical protein VL522_09170, partial [Bordetella sp.]|nr:hypothetical protein [Bordetella sp.]